MILNSFMSLWLITVKAISPHSCGHWGPECFRDVWSKVYMQYIQRYIHIYALYIIRSTSKAKTTNVGWCTNMLNCYFRHWQTTHTWGIFAKITAQRRGPTNKIAVYLEAPSSPKPTKPLCWFVVMPINIKALFCHCSLQTIGVYTKTSRDRVAYLLPDDE